MPTMGWGVAVRPPWLVVLATSALAVATLAVLETRHASTEAVFDAGGGHIAPTVPLSQHEAACQTAFLDMYWACDDRYNQV